MFKVVEWYLCRSVWMFDQTVVENVSIPPYLKIDVNTEISNGRTGSRFTVQMRNSFVETWAWSRARNKRHRPKRNVSWNVSSQPTRI